MPLLILHGLDGNEPDHWQTWLAETAAAGGIDVRYPDLPGASTPTLGAWLDTVLPLLPHEHEEEAALEVVAHSLGCQLWAHVATAMGHAVAGRVLLVAPPGRAQIEREIPTFTSAPLDGGVLLACPDTTVVLGEGDPWLPDPAEMLSGGLPVRRVPGGRHLDVESGYGPWPEMMRWVYGGDAPGEPWQ
jgi:uncharacterized protein